MKRLLRLHPLIIRYRWAVLASLAALLVVTLAQLAVPLIIRQVVDEGLAQGRMDWVARAAQWVAALGAAIAVFSYVQRYLSEWIAAQIGYDLRNRLYEHIQRLPFSFHDHSQTGQLISRCIEDVRALERFAGYGVVDLLRLLLLSVVIVAILFWANARLAWIALLPMLPLIALSADFGRRLGGFFLAVDNALGELSSRLQENVSGVQVVRAFAREPYEIERFDQANRVLFEARVRVIRMWSKVLPASLFLISASTILIIWLGGEMALRGEMTVGEVVAFNGYLALLAIPAMEMTWVVNIAGEAVAGVQRIFDILDHTPEIRSPHGAVALPQLAGRVEFCAASFLYHGETAHALQDIHLIVEPNQVAALVGPTGSGKSSLISLIPRFYDVSAGAVLVDGVDVRQVELKSLRRQIGVVLQTSLLFSTTIRENIAYGRPEASLEEIVAAAESAQAHEFICQFPQGYETVVGERGVTLSGGQRQRVAIARALLLDPRILILDDSTSSVDTETERLIQQALARLMENRTTFVIAHRLSTVRRADLILVMAGGRIVERGVHADLLAQDGLYRQVYELQLRDQETPGAA
ncbi:MAG: ABC transporter ATP-binding protein/permease [Chloroflexi bacterium]|nr:ABC transporter ATP-binding protein/permease [Chloroflexota bacterium]